MALESTNEFYFDDAQYQAWVRIDSIICRNRGLINIIKKQTLKWVDESASKGLMEGHIFYEADLLKAWEQIQRQDGKSIRIKVAQGWPHLPGFEFHRSLSKDNEFSIKVPNDPVKLGSWAPTWIEGRIQAELDKIQPGLKFNPVQVRAHLIQARHAGSLHKLEGTFTWYSQSNFHNDKPYTVSKNERKGCVELDIYDCSVLDNSNVHKKIEEEITFKLAQMRDSRPLHQLMNFKEHLSEVINQAKNGPESLGLNLPLRFLAGLIFPVSSQNERSKETQRLCLKALEQNGRSKEHIDWLDEKTKIAAFGDANYHDDLLVKLFNKFAEESLSGVAIDKRFMTTANLVINPNQLSIVKGILNDLVHRIRLKNSDKGATGTQHCYHLFSHFFPMAIFQEKAKSNSTLTATEHPWLTSILREMTQFPSFFLDSAWLRDRIIMPVDTHEIDLALERLKSQGFIVFDKSQRKWVAQNPTVVTGTQLQGSTASAFYKSIFRTSSSCVEQLPPNMRVVNALTTHLTYENFRDCRDDIEKSSKSLLALEQEETERTMAYTLSMCLFPAEP